MTNKLGLKEYNTIKFSRLVYKDRENSTKHIEKGKHMKMLEVYFTSIVCISNHRDSKISYIFCRCDNSQTKHIKDMPMINKAFSMNIYVMIYQVCADDMVRQVDNNT